MKKRQIVYAVLIATFIITACTSRKIIEKKSDNFIEYNEFISAFHSMNQDMELTNYNNLGGNNGVELVYIDERLSFGKRNYLTLDNKQNNVSTQQRIEYMEDNGESLAVIDVIYLDKELSNDLIYWSNPLSENSENEFIRESYTENIISYKNTLVKISLFATDSNVVDPSMLTGISAEVIEYIQSIDEQE